MTKKQAKKLSIEIWQYLFDNPEIENKSDLPPKLWKKIEDMDSFCPLCEILLYCERCPLYPCVKSDDTGLYEKWCDASAPKTRKKYAGLILEKIKGWEI